MKQEYSDDDQSPTTTALKSSEADSAITANKAMVHHQDPLKCPRCDSSNTKFCYYNNYSLLQPRHFCKACKRYWTHGGTLRNVPVGGGCRKINKRHKKHQNGTSGPKSATAKVDPPRNLPTTTTDLSSFFRSTTSLESDMSNLGYFSGLMRPVYSEPQLSAFGLGGLISSTGGFSSNMISDHNIQSSSTNLLTDQHLPSFGSQAASLLSSLKQPKIVDEYQAMLHYENLQTYSNVNLGLMKEGEVKVEGSNNTRSDQWPVITPFGAFNPSNSSEVTADSSSYLYWNSSAIDSGDTWPDATNSSLAPLI